MKKICLMALIATIPTLVIAQPNLDSLWNIWQDETQPDSLRSLAINQFAWEGYMFVYPDSAFYYAQMGYELAMKKNIRTCAAVSLYYQGVSLTVRGLYPRAMDYYKRSLEISSKIGDRGAMARTMGSIGNIYLQQNDHENALKYFNNAVELGKDELDKITLARMGASIATVYSAQKEYTRSLNEYRKSIAIMEELGDWDGAAASYGNMGDLHFDSTNYSDAAVCFERSIASFKETGNKSQMAVSMGNLGMALQKMNDHRQAIDQCEKSLGIAQEIGVLSTQELACRCLYDTYKAMGKGVEALSYLEQLNEITDSLNSIETVKKLQQLEFEKEFVADSLQQEEAKLKVEMAHQQEVTEKEKTRNWAFAGGGFLLLLAIGLYSRVRYVRKAKARVEIEKERSENLLLNILPAEIAEELKEKGEAAARDFDMVSILFTDFKGFTQASEKLSAADLVAEINTCFKAFDDIVGKYGIEKIKTIGDAYMAAGGLPAPDENAAKNTVLAGLEMQAFMKARKEERDAQGLPGFEMRVGIHTGPVVAGIVGVKKFQYDIWGDTVNTASRMESSGEEGQVNISEATYELVKDNAEFSFTARGKVQAKGKGEMEMYFVSYP